MGKILAFYKSSEWYQSCIPQRIYQLSLGKYRTYRLYTNSSPAYCTHTPVYIGEAGTGNNHSYLYTTGNGSQGQWFTDLVNLIQSSYSSTTGNYSGYPVSNIHWTYWALNTEDSDALLGSGY